MGYGLIPFAFVMEKWDFKGSHVTAKEEKANEQHGNHAENDPHDLP